jgi:hypothetical protein
MNKQYFNTVVAGLTVVAIAWAAKRAYDKAGNILSTDLNPASDQNVAYKTVNAVGATASGDSNFSLGVWLWELFHPAQNAKDNSITDPYPLKPLNVSTIRDPNAPLIFEDRRTN